MKLPGRHTWRRSASARTYRFSKYLHLLGSLVENHPAGGNRDLSQQYPMPTKGPLAETRPSTRLHSMIDDLAKHRNGPVLEYDVYSYLVILCVRARECVCVLRVLWQFTNPIKSPNALSEDQKYRVEMLSMVKEEKSSFKVFPLPAKTRK